MKLEIKDFNTNDLYYEELDNGLIENQFRVKAFMTQEEYNKYVQIRDINHKKLTLEVEEPILDDAERKYLSGVIRPFRDKVSNVIKRSNIECSDEWISIRLINSATMIFPTFKKRTMYKNLKLNKEYTLEELGL